MPKLLFLISSYPRSINGIRALGLAQGLLSRGQVISLCFLQDGVHTCVKREPHEGEGTIESILRGRGNVYCLEEDVRMRGIKREELSPHVMPIGYDELVEVMMEKHDRTLGIF